MYFIHYLSSSKIFMEDKNAFLFNKTSVNSDKMYCYLGQFDICSSFGLWHLRFFSSIGFLKHFGNSELLSKGARYLWIPPFVFHFIIIHTFYLISNTCCLQCVLHGVSCLFLLWNSKIFPSL